MKSKTVIGIVLCLCLGMCLVSACGNSTEPNDISANEYYQSGYEDGYNDGKTDGYFIGLEDTSFSENWYDSGYENGAAEGWDTCYDEYYYSRYDEGYEDGFQDGARDWEYNPTEAGIYFEELATHYARDTGGWHPEEAWMLIDAYRNGSEWTADGSPPTEEDFHDAVDSLIQFYRYFYDKVYE